MIFFKTVVHFSVGCHHNVSIVVFMELIQVFVVRVIPSCLSAEPVITTIKLMLFFLMYRFFKR